MRNGFLIGKFLKAYTSAYRYKTDRRPPTQTFPSAMLAERFAERARRFNGHRGRYVLHVQIALSVALLFMISAFQWHIRPGEAALYTPMEQELVSIEEIVQTQQRVTPPPPPRPPIPVEVPNDELIEDDDLDLDATLDIDEPLAALPPPPPEEEAEDTASEPEIFVVVEEMPEMIGGLAAMLADLTYPSLAQRAGLEGTVVVKVIIEADGHPTNPEVLKGVNEILDKAATEAVMKQTFKPGRQRGRAVRVAFSIPVHFRLTQ